jgi:hypothetical protein
LARSVEFENHCSDTSSRQYCRVKMGCFVG